LIQNPKKKRTLIKGAGDIASGVAYRLYRSGLTVVMTEIKEPTMVRRTVSFAECVYREKWKVEGVESVYIKDIKKMKKVLEADKIPVVNKDYFTIIKQKFDPEIIIDARMMKRSNDTQIDEAPVVIGLGPGFKAGKNVDAVIETYRGHYLGRTIYSGSALAYQDEPGSVPGYSKKRVVSSPGAGIFKSERKIGEEIEEGGCFGYVDNKPVITKIAGVIRGQIHPGIRLKKGKKIGDIDNRFNKDYCYHISDKALAVAGGVLEAICHFV